MMRATRRSGGAQPAMMLPLALMLVSACATVAMTPPATPPTEEQLAQLWMEPADIATRDLFGGPGGVDLMPDANAMYKVEDVDDTGFSAGYDVVDPQGREWRIKLGEEAQPEVVASRLLWAIGFHQPATYFVQHLKLDGGKTEDNGRSGRLRLEEGYKREGDWSWHAGPFVGTRPLKGLIVANLLVNNWDFKTSQNRIYVLDESAAEPRRRYVVQDLGASFGRSKWPIGDRNNVASFERDGFITGVENGIVKFDYHGRHRELFKDITPEDVAWTIRLFARLSDQQLHDAFRAARYPEAVRTRYVHKLKSKIQEGLALDGRAATKF
jgi:hypothetical protein